MNEINQTYPEGPNCKSLASVHGTTVHLHQTDVGDDELQSMADGWPEYYFDRIKELLEK